jgi:hypothetical protein
VQTRYAAGLDRRDWDMVRACFTAGAQASYNGVVLQPGIEPIIEYVRALEALRSSMHAVSNVVADVDGDSAVVETVTVAYLVRDGEAGAAPAIIIRGLRYHDRMVRDGGRWLIAHRVHAPEWMHEVAAQAL